MDNYNKVADILTKIWKKQINTTKETDKLAGIKTISEKMKIDLENILNIKFALNADLGIYVPSGVLIPGEDCVATDENDKVCTEESVNMDELYKLDLGLSNLEKRISEFKQEYKIN